MTVKGFFKSNIFKCLVTLLCVLLISGVFLTIMNGLLAVTPEEKFQRAISKIYGKTVTTETVAILDDSPNSSATIKEAYKVKDDGNYLIKSTGKGGYSGGTVTCWVVVEVTNGSVSGIGKVVVDSNTSQTQMAEINDKFLNSFSTGYEEGIIYTTADGFLVTNSTMSSNAVCSAVNGALDFVNGLLGNAATDPYAEFDYIENIQTKLSSHEYDEATGSVTFHITTDAHGAAMSFKIDVTVDKNGVITDFTIVSNGSTSGYDKSMMPEILNGSLFEGKNLEGIIGIMNNGTDLAYPSSGDLKTGATHSNYLCLRAAAFAAANYDKCIPAPEDGGEEIPPADGGENGEGGNA